MIIGKNKHNISLRNKQSTYIKHLHVMRASWDSFLCNQWDYVVLRKHKIIIKTFNFCFFLSLSIHYVFWIQSIASSCQLTSKEQEAEEGKLFFENTLDSFLRLICTHLLYVFTWGNSAVLCLKKLATRVIWKECKYRQTSSLGFSFFFFPFSSFHKKSTVTLAILRHYS